MGARALSGRYVFDTNVVVSALVFAEGRLAWLRAAWASSAAVPIVSEATSDELLRVLAYPKLRLTADDRAELLGDYLPFAEVFARSVAPAAVLAPDPTDQPFVDLCSASRADGLVTGDARLLALAPAVPVLTPASLRARCAGP